MRDFKSARDMAAPPRCSIINSPPVRASFAAHAMSRPFFATLARCPIEP